MHLTVPELGVLFLLVGGVLHHQGTFAKTRAVLLFLGVVAIGTAGFLGRILGDLGTWAQSAFGSITNWALGVPLAAGLFIILVLVVAHHLHPKGGAKKSTDWIALALGILITVGVAGIPALAGLHGVIDSLLGNAVAALNSI